MRPTGPDDRSTRLLTPERVPLTLPVAGIGERAIATLVDALLLLLSLIALVFVYTAIGRGDLEADVRDATRTMFIVGFVVFLASVVGYDVFCDLVFAGRTPGKRIAKLRVVDGHGRSPDLVTSLLRNVLRLVDLLPFGYGVGAIVMFFTGTRRLGDLVAGTIVISERARGERAIDAVKKAAGDVELPAPRWSDADVAAAVDVVVKTAGLAKQPAEGPCGRVLKKLPALESVEPGTSSRVALAAAVMALARGEEGLAPRLTRLAGVEDELKSSLERFERGTVDAEVLDAVARRASSELLLATRRNVSPRHLESLSLALLDLERRRQPPAGKVWPRLKRTYTVDIPLAVWAERQNIGRAGAVFGFALGLGFLLAFTDAGVGRALVGDELGPMIEQGARWTDDIEKEQAFASTSLSVIINNIFVGLRSFAFGVLGFVGSLLILLYNGVSIGAAFGYATSLGTEGTLLRFIAAHGPVELSMVCVAGAAGMCLGRGVVSPGRRTRVTALREEGRRGFYLMAFAATGFAVIGTVEGFVSPGAHFPVALNVTIGIALWLLFFAWARSGAHVTASSR